jgi:regulator of sirC expression with transglutaminase-like and TPR domain
VTEKPDPADYLFRLGLAGDGPHDIATAALMLSSGDHPGKDLAPYLAHLEMIAAQAKERIRVEAGPAMVAAQLANLMSVQLGYDGDRLEYDDPRNADLIAVIERRRGLPVALGILYLHAARAGCSATGLNAPGHFVICVGIQSQDVLVDPFNGGAGFEAAKLRMPPGPGTVDLRGAMEAVSDTDVLLRLLNNVKLRALEAKDVARALEIGGRMATIAPFRPEIQLELAQLCESADSLGSARKAYEACLAIAKAGEPLHNEAAIALAMLKRRLN